MSSQKGNITRQRPQKYKNTMTFKNTMHDTSKLTTKINALEMYGLCEKCKSIIEWKVKYKKYKPLTKPGVCVKCSQRTVKRAYYTVCEPCIDELKICGKCSQSAEVVIPLPDPKQAKIDKEFDAKLRHMRERERRTIFRIMQSGKDNTEAVVAERMEKCALATEDDDDSSDDSEVFFSEREED